jgi:hypothetical protein
MKKSNMNLNHKDKHFFPSFIKINNNFGKMKIALNHFFKHIDNVTFVIILILYTIEVLSVLQWGIPGIRIPVAYDLDESATLLSVYDIMHHFTNNMPGSAFGPMFFYLQTGIFLAPFYFLHIIDIKAFTHALIYTPAALVEMHRIFIVLRLGSLFINICTLILIYKICKYELKINSLLAVILFITIPVWMIWSVIYRYDVGVVFWIICTLYTLLRYMKNPTRKLYWLNGLIIGFALSTKPTAFPLVPLYIIAYFLFSRRFLKQLSTLCIGLFIICLTFCIVGIPDVLLLGANWGDYVHANITSDTYVYGIPWYIYLLFLHYPLVLGYGLYILFLVTCIYFILQARNIVQNYKQDKNKVFIFLISGFLLFAVSLALLKSHAVGAKLFVILPFLVLLSTYAASDILKKYHAYKFLIYIFLACIICIQGVQAYAWYSFIHHIDIRATSSDWISQHIKKSTTFGIEGIPVYQGIPNVLLLDYQRQLKGEKGIYKYSTVYNNSPESMLPQYVVISNAGVTQQYVVTSPKKDLINNLNKYGWHIIASFQPDSSLLRYFGSERDIFFSGAAASVDIYYKNKSRVNVKK